MRYKTKKFLGSIEAKVLPVSVAVLMIAVALSAVFVILPQDNIVKGASTSDFDHYKSITIDADTYISTGLSNYAIWLYNSSSDFIGLNSTSFSFFDGTGAGATELNWKLERYNSTSGTIGAWVNISSVSASSDTVIYLYYDDSTSSDGGEHNPSSTWDSDYNGVWLCNDASGNVIGSVNSHDGTPTGTLDYHVVSDTGGYSVRTNSTDEYIDFGDDADFEPASGTYELVIKLESGKSYVFAKDDGGDNDGDFNFLYYAAGNTWRSSLDDGVNRHDLGFDLAYNTGYVYLSATYDNPSDNYSVYTNGTLANYTTVDATSIGSTTSRALQMGSPNPTYCGYGDFDFAAISKVVRSEEFLKLRYEAMFNQSTLVTFGSEQGGPAPSSFSLSGLDGNSRITWSGEAGETVWSNATSYGTLTIQTDINSTDNCTAIYLDIADFASTIDADNISVEVRNTADGSWDGTTTALGSSPDYNLTIDKDSPSTWFHGTNPFPIDGTGWTNVTLEVRFKCAIPSDASLGTYVNTSASWNVLWKIIS